MEFERVQALIERGKVKSRIYRLGVELEGGWNKPTPHGTKLEHDGSVQISIPATKIEDVYSKSQIDQARLAGIDLVASLAGKYKKIYTGEIPSMVLEEKDFPAWVTKYYPDYVNETCGMHVHMSFNSALHYNKLMNPSFTACVVEYLKSWAKGEGLAKSHSIWNRLLGKNQYCQPKFYADEQSRKAHKDHNREGHGNRYTIISYPYTLKGTIECRVLPMMETPDQAIRAIQAVIDVTNAFLVVKADRKEERKKGHVIISPGDEVYVNRNRIEV